MRRAAGAGALRRSMEAGVGIELVLKVQEKTTVSSAADFDNYLPRYHHVRPLASVVGASAVVRVEIFLYSRITVE